MRFHAGAALVAIGLALAETWPLATRIDSAYPVQRDATTGEAPAAANPDHLLISWILASNARRLAAEPLGVFETNNQHPFRHTLAFSENFLGVTIPVWPVQAHWRNPVLTANLALLLTLALSAYGVLLLVHELTGSIGAALVAATLSTYTPPVWGRIDQLHAVTGLCTALAFLALVRLVRTRAWGYALLLGALAAWQVWASLHWGFFLALGLASAVLVLLALSSDARRVLPQLAGAAALAGALTIPLAVPYAAVVREMDLTERGVVTFMASPRAAFPPSTASLVERIASGERARGGLTLTPLLAIAGGVLLSLAIRRPRAMAPAMLAAIAAGALLSFWLACGPIQALHLPSLYGLIASMPGLGILRVPARALSYTSLMVAVLAGCGIAAVLHRLGSRAARAALVASFLVLGVVEAGWRPGLLVAAPSLPLPVPPALARLPPECAIAEVPSDFRVQAEALFRSTAHWRPVLNGRSGFYPVPVFAETAVLNRFPEERTLEYLRAAGVCAVLVRLGAPASRRMLFESRARGLRPRHLTAAYDAMLVVLGDAPPAPAAVHRDRAGWRIIEPADGAQQLLDDSLETLRTFRAEASGEPERLTLDLGGAQPVSGVDLGLGSHFRRYLWSYRIEASPDGAAWRTIAEETIAIPPFESYRADPARVVQRIRFPVTTARFLRIGPYRRPPQGKSLDPDTGLTTWGVAEIDVLAPPPSGPHAVSSQRRRKTRRARFTSAGTARTTASTSVSVRRRSADVRPRARR